ncbi:hypothetical protein A3K34_00580 [candidate division WWE3 bacterium RIFOXYC1_FULL_40_10]|uniref:Helix-turn-helix domain-containing protein n=1 Tax=candidate division WWE3 bacterium RIFOXYA2_FULL_46_9 TaxID=1802636 RepID=A0A1F4W3B8_UNCKA|nr:MAG: hypothetical protein A3K58_00580 [candidate division WWE3 bacterium RIFOXYB1_FULL_40_22]OGC61376.1 MAG: hypothetical protein A3K37_00580 [candidate division WWE3 bacterium RIFOXYA1_FULL_40_11]OGC63924.1 MAG: hypothetical protein A2264_02455 [candidate division WWE3 bacterium RIFOXYA2_FULL_46_9]OGC65366.1 MAG: hypothetical protein A2326_04865 [candidate division WWE3 bacterium RIFOXYB2_FULL_41_6]OGC65759.1 MAG: hypothetical protein A3K34_00580 [candidate division WWE3 bacterium RIFOXYC1_
MIELKDRLYTSTEVAEVLGVSLRSVYRYLEEGKLNAEVKTATGRHRFTKQNIVDFLYPDGEKKVQARPKVLDTSIISEEEPKAPIVAEEEAEEVIEVEQEPAKKEAKEETVDWLSKFREAAKKFEEERISAQKEEDPEVEKQQKVTPEKTDNISDLLSEESEPEEKEEKAAEPSVTPLYYRSKLGGLKDVAQSLDKNARESGLKYAFTLNAGLSLFKPIKPFSTLHSYVTSGDQEFFERTLMLVPSDEANAQLCLLISDNNSLYADRVELHGLQVVSREQLLQDVRQYGDEVLLSEAESVLG